MTISIIENVLKYSQSKGNDRLLLISIANHAGGDGYSFPGYKWLVQEMNASRETVKNCIESCEASGELYVDRKKRHNRYIVVVGLTDDEIEKALRLNFEMDGQTARSIIAGIKLKQANQSRTSTKRKKRNRSKVKTNLKQSNQSRVQTNTSLDPRLDTSLEGRPEPKASKRSLTKSIQQQPVLDEPLDQSETITRPNVFVWYEQATGLLLTPMVKDELLILEQEYPEDWLEDAFKEMGRAQAKNVKYPMAILSRWSREGKDNGKRNERSPQNRTTGRTGQSARNGHGFTRTSPPADDGASAAGAARTAAFKRRQQATRESVPHVPDGGPPAGAGASGDLAPTGTDG